MPSRRSSPRWHGGTVQTAGERKEITLPAVTIERFVGTYEVAPGFGKDR